MAIEQQIKPEMNTREGKAPSCDKFIKEGDRLYRQHLDVGERCNLLDEALNEYSRALEREPELPDVTVQMAKIFMRQGQYAKAERYAKKALKLSQDSIQLHRGAKRAIYREAFYVLGQIHYQHANHEKAVSMYLAAIQTGGLKSCRARIGMFQARREASSREASKLKALGHALQAFYALVTGLMLFPFEQERMAAGHLMILIPQLMLAWLAEEFGSMESALQRYLDIYRHYPGLSSVGLIIGDIYMDRAQPEKAQYWFERVIEKHPSNAEAHQHLARLYERQEDYPEMIRVYEKLSRLRPGNPHVVCNLANAYYYNQQYKEALGCYETALHLGTENHWKAMVAQSMANIYADYMQNSEAAVAYYEMAKTLDPKEVENYIQLGLMYFQKDDFINAELIYRKAIKLAPENPRLYSNMGYLRWMEGDIDSAVHYYEKAIELDDGYEIPLNNLGVIYLDTLGKVHRAIELFEKATKVNENYALAYYNLGRAHSFINHRLEAAHNFRIAQDLNRYSRELDNDELTARIANLFDPCEMEALD